MDTFLSILIWIASCLGAFVGIVYAVVWLIFPKVRSNYDHDPYSDR